MFWLKKSKERLFILLIIILSLPALLPLLREGFFLSDDGEWMVIRFSAFHQALVDGQFPVRFLSRLNYEYGYPVANFLYPGFMYLAEIPKMLGLGFTSSIKIVLGLSMVTSGIFIYLWLNKLFGKWPAFIGSLFYIYTPYHLYDLYKRGSVGEILALGVVPFILWQIERKSFLLPTLGTALLIISHNTLALLFLPVIVFYMMLRQVYRYIGILVIALGLSAFFWIPAFFDLQYTRFLQTQVSNWQDHFANIELVGFSTFAILALSIFLMFFHSDTRKYRSLAIFFLLLGSLSAFFSLPISSPVWQILPISLVQFPFRFLSVSVLSIAFLSAFLMDRLKGDVKTITSIALLALLAFSAAPYSRPAVQFDKGDGYYATNEDTTTVQNEYMPKWVKVLPTQRPEQLVEVVVGSGKIDDVVANNREIYFNISTDESGVVWVNKIFFPGWKAFINGKEVAISYENNRGVIDIAFPSGKNTVLVTFGETPIRAVSDIISAASLGLLGLLVFRRR